ncbi:hypothetical protein DFR29_12446 [Tahibacter aquaticus]|uniref:Uncharacterized protein n=2 Tax=Tahibacter aquaticus TaxID=520092 RepID=A0A4R6YL28_9GAMM|nr:hypothetical protein DFR29_12446 [Tahibacter aquaticus]
MLTTLLLAIATTPASASPQTQSSGDDSVAVLLLEEGELADAATGCGIGIAGKRTERAAATAVPAPVIGLGKWVAGLVAGHIKGVATRRLGLDQEFNRFLALSGQLRRIESQLNLLSERFDRLGEQLRAQEFRQLSNTLAKTYVKPVQNATHMLEALACKEADLINAERMGLDTQQVKSDRDIALAEFEQSCTLEAFQNIPYNLTEHFRQSGGSILDRYLDTVVLPQRYLTHQQSRELEDFFYRYHLIQIQALRLSAECMLRFSGRDPDNVELRNSVADRVYRQDNSHFNRARIGTLPQILPDVLPEGVVLDMETGTLWWDGTDFGAHPYANQRGLVREHVIDLNRDIPIADGTRRFQLATLPQVERLAALNAPLPAARQSSTGGDRYPATLKPFLREIGLGKVVERIPDSGNLSFVWTSDRGVSIRRCYTNVPNNQHLRCYTWYDPHDSLGFSAGTAPADRATLRGASGSTFYAPLQCRPNQCTRFWNVNPRVVSLCKDPWHFDADNRCISDDVLGMWQGPGIYRAEQLKTDRFFEFDLKSIR